MKKLRGAGGASSERPTSQSLNSTTSKICSMLLASPAVRGLLGLFLIGCLEGSAPSLKYLGNPPCIVEQCENSSSRISYPIAAAKLPGRKISSLDSRSSVPAGNYAQNLNRIIPFASGPVLGARPFHYSGSPLDQAKAVDCLALAQLYEAGLSERDQAAVAQVILNRVRHPAYPHSICAVVFEGSDRPIGCQFTFTCDGSLSRRYTARAWEQARELASRMLDGEVNTEVGWATHYHTDWVHPYWSSSLDKITKVGSHLFFKWRGFWGTSTAFSSQYSGKEPDLMKIRLSKSGFINLISDTSLPRSEKLMDGSSVSQSISSESRDVDLKGTVLKLVHPDGGSYGLLIQSNISTKDLLLVAYELCKIQEVCRVSAWDSAADVPLGFPVGPVSQKKVRFVYFIDRKFNIRQVHYDCAKFGTSHSDECL